MRLLLVVADDVLVLAINGGRCRMTCMSARSSIERREDFDIQCGWSGATNRCWRTLRREGCSSRSFSGCRCPRNRPPNVTGR